MKCHRDRSRLPHSPGRISLSIVCSNYKEIEFYVTLVFKFWVKKSPRCNFDKIGPRLPRAGAEGKWGLISPALPPLMGLKGFRFLILRGSCFGSSVHVRAHIFNRQAFRARGRG